MITSWPEPAELEAEHFEMEEDISIYKPIGTIG